MPQLTDTMITVTGPTRLKLFKGGESVVGFEMDKEWVQIAEAASYAILGIGLDGFSGRHQDLVRHVQREDRFYMGGVAVERAGSPGRSSV